MTIEQDAHIYCRSREGRLADERDALKAALEALDKQVHICGSNGYGVEDCPGCQVVRPALKELEEK